MLMTAKDMASEMHVKRETIYRWYKTWDGFPRPIAKMRPLLWQRSAFLDWVAASDRHYNKRPDVDDGRPTMRPIDQVMKENLNA